MSADAAEQQVDEEYEVEKIMDWRVKKGLVEYKVRWKGWGASDDTWEGLSNLAAAADAIDAFEANLGGRPAPKRKSVVGSPVSSSKRANAGAASAAPAAAAAAVPATVKKGQKRPLDDIKEEKPAAPATATAGAATVDINSVAIGQLKQVLANSTISRKIVEKLVAARPFDSVADARRRVDGLGTAKINVLLSHGIRFPFRATAPAKKRAAVAAPSKAAATITSAASASASAPAAAAAAAAAAPAPARVPVDPNAKRYPVELVEPSNACRHFVYPNPGPTIDMKTGHNAAPPQQWESNAAAERAANGTENTGRWLGDLSVSLSLAKDARLSELGAAVKVSSRLKSWDEDGMFAGHAGLVPAVRLEQWMNAGKLIPLSSDDMDAISNLAVLSSPNFRGALGNGGWKKAVPFIRSYCRCPAAAEPSTDPADKFGIVKLTFRVYVSRLFFELIADDSYSELVKSVVPCAPFTPCAAPKQRAPQMFTRTVSQRAADNAGYGFSLEGILKSQEHEGYACVEACPAGMKTSFPGLFPFQRSTVKWMMDAEQGPGINSYFWETRPWADGGSFWFFPIGGELRLLQPPEATGGLLAEEMGLGKTIETLALTLLNPRPKSQLTVQYQREVSKLCTRATLIIAPKALIGQWCAELQRYADKLSLVTFDSGDENAVKVDSSCVRRTDGRDSQLCSVGDKVETPFGGSPRWVPATVTRVHRRGDNMLYDLRISVSAEFLCEHDFVFTSYPTLKTTTSNTVLQLLKKISWWRICLDECQMVREATTSLAKSCTDLAGVHRWMISGTPMTTSIDDLNGELKFLRVWPFSLSDKDDGFWEHRIGNAWAARDPAALDLLDPLLSTVLIRHSKSQRQLDGSKLTSLPANSIQWQGLPLGKGSAAYLYLFIEAFVASEVTRRVESGWGRDAQDKLGVDDKRCFQKLRGLMTMLRRTCTDPKLIELPALDDAIRKLERRVDEGDGAGVSANRHVHGLNKMSGKLILMWLRQVGRSQQETANVQTDRSYAVETEATQKARRTYEAMSVVELRSLVKSRGLVDRQAENHQVCVDRFRAVPGGDAPQRLRVPLSELPGDAVDYSVAQKIMAPWSDSVVLHPARVTKAHKQACCLQYMQSHSARETVTKVEGSRLSGNSSREPGSACMMQTVRYGVTASFLRQSNVDDMTASPGGGGGNAAAGGGEDAMVTGTPIMYVEEPGAEPIAGVIQAITTAEANRGEKSYDILLQEFIPVTIDKLNEKTKGDKAKHKDKDTEQLYNVVLDAKVVHVGRSGDTPVPIEDLRPMPRNWDSENATSTAAEPNCFVPKEDNGDTGVTAGTKVLFERTSNVTQKKVKVKLAELAEPYCHRILRHSSGGKSAGGRLVPVDVAATLVVGEVVMMREVVDVDKKQIVDGELLFEQGDLHIGAPCQVNRGWIDHFEAVEGIVYALKYPIDPITRQPNKKKTARYSVVFVNRFKRSKIKKIHTPHEEAAASASSSAAAAAAAAEQEPAILVDVVSAPLHEATVTETFEKSFDLSFGEKKVEAGLEEQRLQRVQRVHLSQVYLCNEAVGGAPVALKPPTLPPNVRALIASQRGEEAAAAAEAELVADWSPFQELKPGMHIMVAPPPLKKELLKRKHIDDKKAPTSSYMRFVHEVQRGEVDGIASDLSVSDIAKRWSKVSPEDKKRYKAEAEAELPQLIEKEQLACCEKATITGSAFDKAAKTIEVRSKLAIGLPRPVQTFTEVIKRPSEGSLVLVFSEDGPVPGVDESVVAASAKLAAISKIQAADAVSATASDGSVLHGYVVGVDYLPSASIVSSAATDVTTDLSLIKSILPGDSIRIQENVPAATHEVGNGESCGRSSLFCRL